MKNFIKPLMFMLLITVMALAVTSCQASEINDVSIEQSIEPTVVVAAVADTPTPTSNHNYGEIAINELDIENFDEIEFNPEVVSHTSELRVEGKSSYEVLIFVEQWALDNFSSEHPIENAILPSALDMVGLNHNKHVANIYFKDDIIPIQIQATVKGNRLLFNIKYLSNADYPAANIGNTLMFQFADAYHEWKLE